MYKYITENNLELRQKYNYSQFQGEEFLKAYFETREDAINGIKTIIEPTEEQTANTGVVEYSFDWLISEANKELVNETDNLHPYTDGLLKSFEVRKRLYGRYTERMKPLDEGDYLVGSRYIAFAELMCEAYEKTLNLKYLNALLKVCDTLISLASNKILTLNPERLKVVLEKEQTFVKSLVEEKGISLY